ncbi:hypothetical protein IGJ55_002673 [Enterococcus sp. AZ170]|uniref:tetratricopeptide repeat protein n=1 Tax=Enterococcus sp. AZ170 TaxID=2774747 RepID=UPI003D2FEB73
MFNFLKKKTVVKTESEAQLTEEQQDEMRKKIEQIKREIDTPELADKELAEKYEELGLLLAQLKEDEQAIAMLEKSQIYKNSIGAGYKKLLNLYNQKRAEAARNGDDGGIDHWMNKMDEMRQIAKQVTIGGK